MLLSMGLFRVFGIVVFSSTVPVLRHPIGGEETVVGSGVGGGRAAVALTAQLALEVGQSKRGHLAGERQVCGLWQVEGESGRGVGEVVALVEVSAAHGRPIAVVGIHGVASSGVMLMMLMMMGHDGQNLGDLGFQLGDVLVLAVNNV
jgi:hypothetical protein